MKNEDFQKTILHELKAFQSNMQDFKKDMIQQLSELKISQKQFGIRQDEMYQELSTKQDRMYQDLSTKQDRMYQDLSTKQDKMYQDLSTKQDTMYQELSAKQDRMHQELSIRQDEAYQVLRAIEHSNNAGKAELDSQNLRVSKIEGKLKKVSKAWQEDVEVSNL